MIPWRLRGTAADQSSSATPKRTLLGAAKSRGRVVEDAVRGAEGSYPPPLGSSGHAFRRTTHKHRHLTKHAPCIDHAKQQQFLLILAWAIKVYHAKVEHNYGIEVSCTQG